LQGHILSTHGLALTVSKHISSWNFECHCGCREGRDMALVAWYDQVIDTSMLANVEVLIDYDFRWSAEL
jgi:lipoate-protein ligase B